LITDPIFYVFALPAVLLTGMSKGGFGGALGGIGTPLMALVVSPRQAAAIMLPVLCIMDLFGVRAYLGKWDVANLKIIIPGAIIGIFLGSMTFGLLSDNAVRIVVGSIAVAFVLRNALQTALADVTAGLSRLKGTVWSALSGFTSFVAHAGGPPIMMYLMPQKLDKVAYVATINFFFMVTNAVKLLAYTGLGQFTQVNISTSLVLAPAVPVGVWSGLWLQTRINQAWFYRIAQFGLLLTGVQLIYQGSISS
jgi:uncharacterized membrane protein YfcA